MNLLEKCEAFYKLARKSDDLDILHVNVGNYIHFSNSERFGISFHKNIHPFNPRGLYGIKLTSQLLSSIETKHLSSDIEEYGSSKYIYIFSVSGNVINIDTANQEDIFKRIKAFILSHYEFDAFSKDTIKYFSFEDGNYHNKRNGDPFTIFWSIRKFYDILKSSKVVVNEHSFVNIILRGIGIDALETNNFGLEDNIKSQIVVLTPSSIQLVYKINNPII